jgi:uncharacterized protein YhbP (UPF0306 family)
MTQDLSGRITAFLDLYHVMSLATCGPDGAHAASVFYVRDGLSLCWVSDAETRHSHDLEANPRVAATVAPDYTDFAAIRGVQMHGHARRVTDTIHRAGVLFLMVRRYPFLGRIADAPAALRAAYERIQVYQLTPADIVLIDNTKGFGHKETLAL